MFQFRLAAKLGVADVDALADSLSEQVWLEWQAVALIEGWATGWQQSAEIIAAIRNASTRSEIVQSSDPPAAARSAKFTSGFEVQKVLTDFGGGGGKRDNLTPAEHAKDYFRLRYGK